MSRDQNTPRRSWRPPAELVLPCTVAAVVLLGWEGTVRLTRNDLFPGPWEVVLGIVELIRKGLLLKYIVASLFRVTWGFFLAILVGVPLGLFLGWFRPAFQRRSTR